MLTFITRQGRQITKAGRKFYHDTKRLRDYSHSIPTARFILLVRARNVPVAQNNLYASVKHHSGRRAKQQPSRYLSGPLNFPAPTRSQRDLFVRKHQLLRFITIYTSGDLHFW